MVKNEDKQPDDENVEAEAPEATEPEAVEVSPEEAPTLANIHGKDYEVTPERGYRVKQ